MDECDLCGEPLAADEGYINDDEELLCDACYRPFNPDARHDEYEGIDKQ